MEFQELGHNVELARRDAGLLANLAQEFDSQEFADISKSNLFRSAAMTCAYVVREARAVYAEGPERLVGIIVDGQKPNALAAWPQSGFDWIVLSTGLIQRLSDAADDFGRKYCAAFPRLNALLERFFPDLQPIAAGPSSALGSLIFFGGVAYFAGHEAGHHLGGHSSYYGRGGRAHSEADNGLWGGDESGLAAQALEVHADRVGLRLMRMAVLQLMIQSVQLREFSVEEKAAYQELMAILISAGAMMAAAIFNPARVEWERVQMRTHPPSTARVLLLAMQLSADFKNGFDALPSRTRKWIGVASLEAALEAVFKPKDLVEFEQFLRRKKRGEPAAVRYLGARKLLYETRFSDYVRELHLRLASLTPDLAPRTRSR
jgi:hypothetical protein